MTAAFLSEWLALALRWFHVIAGVAWVGASFYFTWVENALERGGQQRAENIAGHLWSVHGGGFYYLEKYRAAPDKIPPRLHWFKWEAYATWLSGMGLMILLYYAAPSARLLPPESPLSPAEGVAVGLATIVLGYAIYAALCRMLLAKPLALAAIGLVLLSGLLFVLSGVFAPRAAYIHLGAVIGAIMAGNVLFVIIPSQKRMVAAASEGGEADAQGARRAGLRSLHNNYLTLPVVFVMISGHHPAAANHDWNWLTFAALALAGGFARHFFNLKHRGTPRPRWLALAAVGFALAAGTSIPQKTEISGTAAFARAKEIIARRCVSCHSESPSDSLFPAAPLGFVLDTDAQIRATVADIHRRTIMDRSMPFNNRTGMTEEERAELAAWLQAEMKDQP